MKVEEKEILEKNSVTTIEKSKENNQRLNTEIQNINNKKKERDISVDLIRLIACIIVIATHLALTTFNIYEQQVDWSRLFTKCFLADGVAIFFLITGFFILNGKDYKKRLKTTLKKIILPSFLVLVFSQVFYSFLVNQETFVNCLKNFGMDNVKAIFSSILHGEVHQTVPVAAHLWYIFAYLQIIVIFPVLQLLCKDDKQSNLARRILIILALLNILVKDVQKFWIPKIGEIEVFSILDPKLLLVLTGYELYYYREKIKNNKKCTILGFVIFWLINIIRYKAEMQYMINNQLVKEAAFISWDTMFGFISAISLFVAIYSFDIKNSFLCNIISKLSSMTFGIYLIHFMIIAKVDIFKFEKISTVKYELLYMFLGTLIVFVSSLIIVSIIKMLNKYFGKCIEKLKTIKNEK